MSINPILRVCIVTTAFPRWFGDSRAPFVWGAAKALKDHGLAVRVVAMHNPGAKSYEMVDEIPIYRPRYLPEGLEVLQKESGGIPQAWKSDPLSRFSLIPFFFVHALCVSMQARNVEIIHANWSISGAAALITQWIHHKPVVITVQGSDVFQASKIRLVKEFTRIVLSKANKVIALSNSLLREATMMGVPLSNIQVIPNGVDVKLFPMGASQREPLIVFVGSLIERKGVEYLILAFHKLREQWPQGKLKIIGDGNQNSYLRNLVNSLGLENRVEFLGNQPQSVVSSWLRNAQVLVLPSIEEGLGVVLLEALSSGTPCVGSKVGGIADVITPEVGILVPPADSQKLAEAIYQLVRDPQEWTIFSNNARYRAETVYNWEKIGEKIIEVYKMILQ